MGTRTLLRRQRTKLRRPADELLVCQRVRGQRERIVALQWRDGAGELHYEALTPAQSWPYLAKCS